MTKKQISKHPRYTDPTAFSKNFPRIEPITLATPLAILMGGVVEKAYKMGPIRVGVVAPTEERPFYFMSIHGRDRYPTWDEMVWLRYNLIPDAAMMMNLLPNLNAYINIDGEHHQFVFTMEQRGWALDPIPTCDECSKELVGDEAGVTTVDMTCPECGKVVTIDMTRWNEDHGNGFNGRKD